MVLGEIGSCPHFFSKTAAKTEIRRAGRAFRIDMDGFLCSIRRKS
jgi:hypothetical protein